MTVEVLIKMRALKSTRAPREDEYDGRIFLQEEDDDYCQSCGEYHISAVDCFCGFICLDCYKKHSDAECVVSMFKDD